MTGPDLQIADHPERERFEGRLGDELVGVVEYIALPGKVIATHAEVGEDFEGRGMASQLVGGMVEQLRTDGRLLQPLCPYVRAWLQRHPEAADVVDPATPH